MLPLKRSRSPSPPERAIKRPRRLVELISLSSSSSSDEEEEEEPVQQLRPLDRLKCKDVRVVAPGDAPYILRLIDAGTHWVFMALDMDHPEARLLVQRFEGAVYCFPQAFKLGSDDLDQVLHAWAVANPSQHQQRPPLAQLTWACFIADANKDGAFPDRLLTERYEHRLLQHYYDFRARELNKPPGLLPGVAKNTNPG